MPLKSWIYHIQNHWYFSHFIGITFFLYIVVESKMYYNGEKQNERESRDCPFWWSLYTVSSKRTFWFKPKSPKGDFDRLLQSPQLSGVPFRWLMNIRHDGQIYCSYIYFMSENNVIKHGILPNECFFLLIRIVIIKLGQCIFSLFSVRAICCSV